MYTYTCMSISIDKITSPGREFEKGPISMNRNWQVSPNIIEFQKALYHHIPKKYFDLQQNIPYPFMYFSNIPISLATFQGPITPFRIRNLYISHFSCLITSNTKCTLNAALLNIRVSDIMSLYARELESIFTVQNCDIQKAYDLNKMIQLTFIMYMSMYSFYCSMEQ